MPSKVSTSIAGSGRGSSDAALQANFTQIKSELNAFFLAGFGGPRFPRALMRFTNPVLDGQQVSFGLPGSLMGNGVVPLPLVFEFDTSAPPGALTSSAIRVGVSAAEGGTGMPNAVTKLVAAFNANIRLPYIAVDMGGNTIAFVRKLSYGAADDNVVTSTTSTGNSLEQIKSGQETGGQNQQSTMVRFPVSAAAVTAGYLHFYLEFYPDLVIPRVYNVATHAQKLWDGAITVTRGTGDIPHRVTLDNTAGTVHFVATDFIVCECYSVL